MCIGKPRGKHKKICRAQEKGETGGRQPSANKKKKSKGGLAWVIRGVDFLIQSCKKDDLRTNHNPQKKKKKRDTGGE